MCIIHIKKGNYCKLPGGGVEADDPHEIVAAQSEPREETGCKVRVATNIVAKTLEYRGKLKQVSHAYICQISKDTGKPKLTELEATEVRFGRVKTAQTRSLACSRLSSIPVSEELTYLIGFDPSSRARLLQHL